MNFKNLVMAKISFSFFFPYWRSIFWSIIIEYRMRFLEVIFFIMRECIIFLVFIRL